MRDSGKRALKGGAELVLDLFYTNNMRVKICHAESDMKEIYLQNSAHLNWKCFFEREFFSLNFKSSDIISMLFLTLEKNRALKIICVTSYKSQLLSL
jgi:hypothetical protein